MNTRIKLLREKHLKLSQTEFAEILNLKRNSISLIEVGKRNPSDRTILDICQKFNVSETWIRTGNGEIFINTPSSTMEQLKKEFDLDEFSYNLVYEYLKLDKEKRYFVRDFLYSLLNNMDSQELSATIQTQEQLTSHSESAEIKNDTVEKQPNNLSEIAANVDIDKETEGFRQNLELQKKVMEESSVFDGTKTG